MPDLETGRGSPIHLHPAGRGARGHGSLPWAIAALALPLFVVVHLLFSPLHFLFAPLTSGLQAPAPASRQYGPALPLAGAMAQATDSGGLGPLGLQGWQDERIYLIGAAEWTERSRASIDEALTLLPASVRSALGNPDLGPLYVLVDTQGRTLSGRQPYGRAANFYSTNEGRNEIVLFPDQTARTVLHELGHAYNLRRAGAGSYAQVYLDPEMLSFLSAADWRVLTPASRLGAMRDHAEVGVVYQGKPVWSRVSRDDPLEDFANSFAAYFAAPDELLRLSPGRYDWFKARFGQR
jgi:hypothetical protein